MPELLPIAGATPLPGEARDLAPGLRWLRFPLPFPPGHVNVWLLEEEAGWLAVDSGVESRETRAHWSTALAGAAFGGRPLTNLLVTHFHPDHVGLAGWLAERHGMLPMMTRVEWLMTRALWFDIGPEMTEQQVAFAAAAGCPEHYLAYLGQRGALYVRAVARPPRSFHAIRHGQALAIGGREWRVITGAGHAPDMAGL